jgi:hypothetical protein
MELFRREIHIYNLQNSAHISVERIYENGSTPTPIWGEIFCKQFPR